MQTVKRALISIVRPIYRLLFERPIWWFLGKVKVFFFAEISCQMSQGLRSLEKIEKELQVAKVGASEGCDSSGHRNSALLPNSQVATLPDKPLAQPTADAAAAEDAHGPQVVTSYEELDDLISQAEEAAHTISDDERRRILHSFRFKLPVMHDLDPWSDEYRRQIMTIYERITRKAYDVQSERYSADVSLHVNRPFPYITQSWQTVGNQLIAIGFAIRAMKLPAGARVLELGVGQGSFTLALAQMGYRVTAVDIDPNNVEIVRQRAQRNAVEIETLCDDFFVVERLRREFDAVLFYESFHHCDDHLRLLKSLGQILASSGLLAFVGEPIVKDFPYPWGFRTDGESIRGVRYFGWLELGFNEDYFFKTLLRFGYFAEQHWCPLTGAGHTYVARRQRKLETADELPTNSW